MRSRMFCTVRTVSRPSTRDAGLSAIARAAGPRIATRPGLRSAAVSEAAVPARWASEEKYPFGLKSSIVRSASPPIAWTFPSGSILRVKRDRAANIVPIRSHSSVSGCRTSAERRFLPSVEIPPAIRIEPSSSLMAAWKLRGSER